MSLASVTKWRGCILAAEASWQRGRSLVLDMLSGKDMWTILVEKFRMQLNL